VFQHGGTRLTRLVSGGSNLGATLHHGWKAVAALTAQGALPVDYAGTERPEVAWYLQRIRRCPDGASPYIAWFDRELASPSTPVEGLY